MALIAGAAGVGKSRLAREVARDARQLGYRVLQGSCYSRESIQPYGPFVEALETYLATHPSWRTDLAVRYPHFGQLIPSLAGAGVQPAEQISPDFVHASLLSSFASVLAELAESHPLLLVLDDLHEADRASLELLQHLVHTAESHRWFIMGTYRDDEIPPGSAVQRTLSAATRAGLSRRITLRGLSSNDTRRLVVDLLGGGAVDTTLCHRIYSLTLGNPLFVQELVSSLRENGMLERVSGCWRAAIFWPQPMPHHIRALVSARVMRLGETAVQVLHLAAVAGMEWSPSDLRTAAQIAFPTWFDEELLLQILDRALDASILEDRGETYAFKHPMIRRALLDETPSHRAARFHAAVGAAIERHRPHDLDDLAFHFGKSHDDEKAIRYLRDAAVHAQALHTDDVAERHLRDLLERYERLGRTWDAADAREQLGIVLDSAEQYEEALEELSLSEDAFRSLEDLESARRVACRMKRLRSRQPTAESVCPDAPLIIEMARVP